MGKDSFQARLDRAKRDGNLTTADLAIWFGRPYHTVRGWLEPRSDRDRRKGYEPWGPHREEAMRRLVNLERFVRHNKSSYVMGPRERAQWLTQVAREFNGALPKAHSTA